MTKRMLVDATHPEETRVAIVDGNWLSDFDFERASRKQLKGNIYLAKVIRVEPSLQAAFVEYGGNRHGFLPFSEIHPDYFRIPMADRPHGEEDGDDAHDQDDNEDPIHPDVAAAYADEVAAREAEQQAAQDHAEHAHEHNESDHQHNMAPVAAPVEGAVAEVAVPAEPAPLDPQQTQPVTGFDADHAHDLGLITDFGNAALPAAQDGTNDGVIRVETVGGEVAEAEEERAPRQVRPRYKIQEVVKRRQVMLIQVVKEERGNKGAALTTFLSLAGRYCVLMPNTDHGGGVSRKITNHQDRRRMKEILDQLEVPEGMAVILRTAGMEQEPAEIQRDAEHLLRLWNNIREQTLQSTAPALIYEEANLIKRSIRDLYSSDVAEILVAGQRGHQLAGEFMRTILPDQVDVVKLYEDPVPLFFRYNVEKQIDALYSPTVQLRSGGYIVINPTEALVSIDVNSGRATRERHIESTALKTNLEAADEVARQLRLRDLAGLVVIDFIDMEDGRNNAAVERRLKEAMRNDRARLQIGRISPFGLMELSRQRLHPSLMEINFERCPHCAGLGLIRSLDSAAISVLRMIEEEGIRQGNAELMLHVPTKVALYILNQKRQSLTDIEKRYGLTVFLHSDDTLVAPDCKIERMKGGNRERGPAVNADQVMSSEAPAYERSSYERTNVAPERSMSNGSDAGMMGDNSGSDDAGQGGRASRPPREGGRGEGRGRGGERGGRNRSGRGEGRGERGGRGEGRGERTPRDPNAAPNGNTVPVDGENANGNVMPSDALPPDNIGNAGGEGFAPRPAGAEGEARPGRRRGRRGGRGRRNNGDRAPREGGDFTPREGGEGAPQMEGADAAPQGERTQNERPQGDRPQRDRAPRDRNFRDRGPRPPRDGNREGNRDGNRDNNRGSNYAPAAHIPTSIHDIDTTPRDYTSKSASQSPSAPPPYEVVQDSSDDKAKGGWWKKLTGGQ